MVRATKALLQAAAKAARSSRLKRLPQGSNSSTGPDGLRGPHSESTTEVDVVNSAIAADVVKIPRRPGRPPNPPDKPKRVRVKPPATPWFPADDLVKKHRSIFHKEHNKQRNHHASKDHLSGRADVASEQLCGTYCYSTHHTEWPLC
jgi:hypothetical protein